MPTDQSSTSISPKRQTLSSLDPLRQKLQQELERSLLLEEEDRAYWLENLAALPIQVVENLLKTLTPKNQLVNTYINAALAQDKDQEHLKELKAKVKRIIQQAYQVEETADTKSEQKNEADLLQQLDKF